MSALVSTVPSSSVIYFYIIELIRLPSPPATSHAIVYLNHIGGPAPQGVEHDLTDRGVVVVDRGPWRATPDLGLLVEEGGENRLCRHFASPILNLY